MRPKNEVESGEELFAFIQQDLPRTGLIVASPPILADTVRILWRTVTLLNKVLPLKSVFNWVQRTQRLQYFTQALAAVRTRNMAESGTQQQVDLERELALIAELDHPISLYLESQRTDPDIKASIALDLRVSLEELQHIEQQASRFLATEDIFVAACMYVRATISKDRAIFFIEGESPEFKEPKRDRTPVMLGDVPKIISHSLSRPDSDRGRVEQDNITAAYNYIVRLYEYYAKVNAVAAYLNEDPSRTKKDAMNTFGISHTDFERIMVMARREGVVGWRTNRKPSKHFALNAANQKWLSDFAAQLKITEGRALNEIVARFIRAYNLRREQRERRLLAQQILEEFRKQDQVKKQENSQEAIHPAHKRKTDKNGLKQPA